MTLSLFLIVKNEEKYLENALKNAHLYADEIIVVDTGSTDASKKISARYTNKIYEFPWQDDFSLARNFAIGKCTKNYIMWLDADDRIGDKDTLKIKKLLSHHELWDVYFLPYHYLFQKNGQSTIVISRERIFRNNKNISFIYPVHECLDFPDTLRTTSVDIPVYHKGNTNDQRALLMEKKVRNIAILKKALSQKAYRNSTRLLWCLAREYMYAGQPEKAITAYIDALQKTDTSVSHLQKSHMHYELATQFIVKENMSAADEELEKALAVYNDWREPYILQAKLAFWQNDYSKALHLLFTGKKIPLPVHKDVLDLSSYKNTGIDRWIALSYLGKGTFAKALYYFFHSLF